MMNISKKIIILISIILTVLSALTMCYAIATPEMDATGISLADKNVGDTVMYTLNDLYTKYDIFCSEHGTHAFIDGEQFVEIAGMSIDATDLSKDTGTELYSNTYYNYNTPSSFVDGEEAVSIVIDGYEIKEKRIATPKEAYILAEMTENTMYNERVSSLYEFITDEYGNKVPASVSERDFTKTFDAMGEEGVLLTIYSIEEKDDDGRIESTRYYVKESEVFYEVKLTNVTPSEDYGILSYVQNAWWTTEAGSLGEGVTSNELATEAEAFEDYILRAAEVTNVSELDYVLTQYNFTDMDENTHTGEVMAPRFEYNPTWNEDANNDNVINENDDVVVAWDGDTQTYKVGPFSINYVKGKAQTGTRAEKVFADITEAKIVTDIGTLVRVSSSDTELASGEYRFIYKDGVERTEDSEFPNPNEVFYLEIAYDENMTEITNIDFNFKYMNAGGEYQYLEGTGTKQTWTVKKDVTNYNPCTDETCERTHYEYGGNYYHQNYFRKTDVKIECTSVSTEGLQTFAYGVNAARWYEETSLELNDELEIWEEGSIVLEKIVVDEDGNPVKVSEDTDFFFILNIRQYNEDGSEVTTSEEVKVTVKEGQSIGKSSKITTRWKRGLEAPDYIVKESELNGYEFKDWSINGVPTTDVIVNGKFNSTGTISAMAMNEKESDSGDLTIRKVPIGQNLLNKSFYFNIYIDGNLYIEKAEVNASTDWKYTMPAYTWVGNTPKYRVVEVNEDGNTVTTEDGFFNFTTWKSGYLEKGRTVKVYEWNIDIPNEGTLEVSKILKNQGGKEIFGKQFEFRVKVDGYEEITLSLASGEKWSQTFYWYGDEAPNYTVTEVDNEDYEFVSIETTNGTISGKTAAGNLIKDNIVSVTANNKDNKTITKNVQITKKIVTENGEEVAADKDTSFKFNLEITKEDGSVDNKGVEVVVKAGQSTAISQPIEITWNSSETAPTYKVTETMINNEYELLKMENGEGSLDQENTIISVIADNIEKEDDETGSIKITKQIVDENGNLVIANKDTTFGFDLKIIKNEEITTKKINVTVERGQSTATSQPIEITWKKGEEVRYIVTETKIDGEYTLVEIINDEGILAKDTTIEVIAKNKKTDNDDEVGKIKITKKVVDKDGNPVKVNKDTIFVFDLEITKSNGETTTQKVNVTVKEGQSAATSQEIKYSWPKGEAAPTYKVTETEINGEYTLVEIINDEGILSKSTVREVIATNEKEEDKVGSIKITKQIVDEDGNPVIADEDTTFKFNLEITKSNGEIDNKDVEVIVSAGQSIATSQEFTYYWKEGEAAPTYKVTETMINEKYELLNMTNGEGILNEDTTINVIATNEKLDKEAGKIKITKQIVDKNGNPVNADEDTTFKFNLEITRSDGSVDNKEIEVVVKEGQNTATSQTIEIVWNPSEAAPTYKVTETMINEKYELLNMTNGEGTLQKDLTIEVVAKNKQLDNVFGKIKITKQVVDKDGKPIKVDKDTTFGFDLEITQDGKTTTQKVNVTVKKGQSTATSQELTVYWEKGEAAPTYKVTETMINEKYELLDMINGEGTLGEDTTINVIATNKVKELKGTLKIIKRIDNIDDAEILNNEYEVKINKNGEYYKTVIVSVDRPYSEEFAWDATETTPVITLEEINLPPNTELIGYINNGANLLEGKETIIIVDNTVKLQKGKIQISKELIDTEGNSIVGVPFEFKLSVEGYEDKIITIKSGETWRSDYFYWTSVEGPNYTVTELENENYEFVSVNSSTGTVSGKSVSGKLINNVILDPIRYINKTQEENEGSIKITKKLEADDKIDLNTVTDKFEFAVTIYYENSNKYFEYNGEKYNSLTINRNVHGQNTTEPINIKWYGTDAPKYNVKEINLPNDWRFKEFSTLNYGVFQNEVEVICVNEQVIDRKYYFTMEMGGKVWNDTNYEDGKPADVDPDGIIGESEEGLSDIKVSVYKVIKTSDGRVVDRYIAGEIIDSEENVLPEAILNTNQDGIWKIRKISVPALTQKDKDNGYTKESGYSAAYDVEFTYDGQTYEPTKFLEYSNSDASRYLNASLAERDNYLNDSMAIDNVSEREYFNKKFQTISGKEAMDDNGNTIGKTISGNDAEEKDLYYSSTDKQALTDSSTKKVSTLELYDENGKLYELFEMKASTLSGGLLYPFDSKTVFKNADVEINYGVKTISYYYHAAYPYLNSINLGLVERKNTDMAIEKDLVDATVVVNGKALKYTYGEIANAEFDTYPDLLYKQIQVVDKEIEYKLDLYKSDYYYRASMYNGTEVGEAMQNFYASLGFTGKEEVELDVYLKYKITVTNESDSYYLEAKEISDYYDSDMELVSTNVSKYIQENNGRQVDAVTTIAEASYKYNSDGTKTNISWSNNGNITDSNSGKTYNRITTTGLFGDKLSSGEARSIYVTFKVKKAIDSTTGIENCIKLGSKYNIAEIDSYSTYYQDGRVAGKVEEDSAPGNINIVEHNESTWYEDDTTASPVLIIGLYDVKREMNGLVWEDEETETIQYEQKVGNGVYDSSENVIPNMTTKLYEKVTVNGIDYDFLWPTDSTTILGLNGYTIEQLTGLDSSIVTNGEGKYNFAGIAAGNYIVRFTYGDNNTINYSGQDYKSTTYQAGFDNDSDEDGIIDNIWHDLLNVDLAEARVSDARDGEARRLDVISKSQTLTYANTAIMAGKEPGLEEYYMEADTAKINMNIEKDVTGTENIYGITVNTQKGYIDTTIGAVGATNITYNVNNIDFGLEKRSETNIVLDKQIEEIKLTTSTGEIILDAVYDISYTGDVANVVLNTEKSIGTNNLQALNKSESLGLQGFRYINIDEDILQGATIEVRYRFTVLNTSEVDRCATKLKEITDFNVAIAEAAAKNSEGIFGTYLGKVYYSGKGAMNASGECDDAIVETTVHKLVDYVDNDVVFSSTANIVKDGSWTNTTTEQLKDMKLIDTNIINEETGKILDEESRAYESENKNNLIISVDNSDDTKDQLTNPGFIKALKPYNVINEDDAGEYSSSITLTVSRYYSSESDSEAIDNLAEIIEIYNDVGRRDVDVVQGNANPAEGAFVAAIKENDSSATEVITLTPPTGLSAKVIFTIQVLSVILSAIAILTGGIIAIKKKVLTK